MSKSEHFAFCGTGSEGEAAHQGGRRGRTQNFILMLTDTLVITWRHGAGDQWRAAIPEHYVLSIILVDHVTLITLDDLASF